MSLQSLEKCVHVFIFNWLNCYDTVFTDFFTLALFLSNTICVWYISNMLLCYEPSGHFTWDMHAFSIHHKSGICKSASFNLGSILFCLPLPFIKLDFIDSYHAFITILAYISVKCVIYTVS